MTNIRAIESLQNIVEYWTMRPTEQEAARLAIKALEQQDNERWIPVGVRLPTMEECQNNDCRFIVTDDKKAYQKFYDYHKVYDGGFFDFGIYGYEKDGSVVAWKPMPEPYKEN